jgi:hypothetical protein
MVKREIIQVPLPLVDGESKHKLRMIEYKDGKFTKNDIKKQIQELSNQMKKQNKEGYIKSNLRFGSNYPRNWYGSRWTDLGKKVDMFNLAEYDEDLDIKEPKYFKSYRIFIRDKLSPKDIAERYKNK